MSFTRDKEIWHMLDSRSFGGIESHVYHMAKALKEQGYTPRIVFMNDYGEHPLLKMLEEAELPALHLDGSLKAIRKVMQLHQPQCLHTHGYKAGIIGRLAARLEKRACISTFHNADANTWKLKAYTWLDAHTAWLADKVIAVSPQIAAHLPCKTSIINNFVPVPDVPVSQGTAIAFVGRLSHEKAPDRFIKLAEQFPNLPFAVYGDGELRDTLSKPDNITWHGQVASMESHWQAIGLLVICSRQEGLPMAALEAMAHGVPVVTFALGGLPQLINHGENGFIAQTGDMDALAHSIQRWAELSNSEQQTIKKQARDTIMQRYSPDAVLPEIISLYEAIS